MIKVVRGEKPRGQINLQNKRLAVKEKKIIKDLKALETERRVLWALWDRQKGERGSCSLIFRGTRGVKKFGEVSMLS